MFDLGRCSRCGEGGSEQGSLGGGSNGIGSGKRGIKGIFQSLNSISDQLDHHHSKHHKTIIMKWTLALIGTILVSYIEANPVNLPSFPNPPSTNTELSKFAAKF